MKTVFITGATGFLGSYFLYHLLQHTNDMIYCLARDKKNVSAGSRIHQKLNKIHSSYSHAGISRFNLEEKMKKNLKVVTGDIAEKDLGLKQSFKEANISECWHIAANVQFMESKRDEIMGTNVTGGKNILEFMKQNKIPLLNYVSTAYVAGQKTGEITESLADEKFPVNNAYEESKRIMEKLIVEANTRGECNYRIFRPGIIVGHSVTFDPDDSKGGMYGFLSLCTSFKEQVNNNQVKNFETNSIKLLADKNAMLSLIPVDHVVNILFDIAGQKGSDNRIYHVTPLFKTSLIQIGQIIKKLWGLEIDLVPSGKDFTITDRLFNRQVSCYARYLFNGKHFKRSEDLYDYRDEQYRIDNKKLYALIEKFFSPLKREITTSSSFAA